MNLPSLGLQENNRDAPPHLSPPAKIRPLRPTMMWTRPDTEAGPTRAAHGTAFTPKRSRSFTCQGGGYPKPLEVGAGVGAPLVLPGAAALKSGAPGGHHPAADFGEGWRGLAFFGAGRGAGANRGMLDCSSLLLSELSGGRDRTQGRSHSNGQLEGCLS